MKNNTPPLISSIVGLCGRAGAGKDTVGDWLVANRGYTRTSFAAPIYAALAAMGFPAPATREEKEALIPGFNFSWRQAAQTLGTEWGRTLQADLWLRIVEQKVKSGTNENFVVTDVRFENEADMIRDAGGTILHISGRASDLGSRASHVSELPVMFHYNKDVLVDNGGTVKSLHKNLGALFHE